MKEYAVPDVSPRDLGLLGPADLAGVSAELAARVDAKVELFAAPRDRTLAFEFIRQRGPLGRVFLYGAGTHASEFISLLEHLPGTSIAGVIDRRWEEIGALTGYDVIGPDRLRARAFDHVLVANGSAEPEIVQQLVDIGVSRDQIVTVYTDPTYARRARRVVGQALIATLPGHADHVILEGAPGGVFQTASLVPHLPPEDTVILRHYSYDPPSPFYRTYETRQSLGLVIELLRQLQPRVIYVRSQFTTHFLAFLARRAVPTARIIHEIHDFALLTPCDALVALVCRTQDEVRTIRLAELDSLSHSDAVLSKHQGPVLDHVTAITRARHFLVYPWLLEQPEPRDDRRRGEALIRVVYAGQLYPPGFPKTLEAEWNYLPLFLHLVRSGRCTVDAFNSLHQATSADDKYSAYLQAARQHTGFAYHRALTYRQVVGRMAQFDYGLLYTDDPRADNVSGAEAIAARMTGYLNAGLPVVLDEGHTLMARLVRDFGAGVLLPRRGIERLVPALLNAHEHAAALRTGARRLHAHMTENNQRVIEALWR